MNSFFFSFRETSFPEIEEELASMTAESQDNDE